MFDNDSDSIASAKTGENSSRKGSIVSFMSSITPSAGGSEASLEDPSTADYKYVDTINKATDLNSDFDHPWVPQATKSGKLYFAHSTMKVYTPNLPFEPVSPEMAKKLAAAEPPSNFDPPPDISGLAQARELNSEKTESMDTSANYLLSRSDPYTNLVGFFAFIFFFFFR